MRLVLQVLEGQKVFERRYERALSSAHHMGPANRGENVTEQ